MEHYFLHVKKIDNERNFRKKKKNLPINFMENKILFKIDTNILLCFWYKLF